MTIPTSATPVRAQVLERQTMLVRYHFVRLRFDADAYPTELIADLAEAGFKAAGVQVRPVAGTHVHDLVMLGTGPFGSWTAQERTRALADLRRVLEDHGLPFAPRPLAAGDLP